MPTQIFIARFESLDAIREFVVDAAHQAGLDEKEVYNVQLAADEAASNIIEHAYEGVSDGQIEISTDIEDASLRIVMREQGKPFDPEEIAAPDVSAKLEDRLVGGLGLFFMRKLMDEVHFQYSPESGNVLTMLKHLPAARKALKTQRSNWRGLLFGLGERILATTSFSAQRNLVFETAARLVADAEVVLWIHEPFFRLPDWAGSIFPLTPPTEFIGVAHETGKTVQKQVEDRLSLAIPLRHEQIGLGVIEVHRLNGKKFSRRELDLLEGLARMASIALLAWHSTSVERWRLGPLSLVRTVSAQIANEPDIDELARKVTRLIQSTFKYYYVAIFTLERGRTALTFRSGAGGAMRRKKRAEPPSFSVELGQGLIGAAAAGGEQVLVNDVGSEPRFRHLDNLPETRSEIVIPLKIEERVGGVLDVQSSEIDAVHPRDLLVLRALADNVAVAVEGAQMYSDIRHQADQLRVVSEVSKQITSILNLRDLMQAGAGTIYNTFE